ALRRAEDGSLADSVRPREGLGLAGHVPDHERLGRLGCQSIGPVGLVEGVQGQVPVHDGVLENHVPDGVRLADLDALVGQAAGVYRLGRIGGSAGLIQGGGGVQVENVIRAPMRRTSATSSPLSAMLMASNISV